MLLGIPRSARCVQRFDDSLNSAIHITYRIALRSSSMREPRDPLLKVVQRFFLIIHQGAFKEHSLIKRCVCKARRPEKIQEAARIKPAAAKYGTHRRST